MSLLKLREKSHKTLQQKKELMVSFKILKNQLLTYKPLQTKHIKQGKQFVIYNNIEGPKIKVFQNQFKNLYQRYESQDAYKTLDKQLYIIATPIGNLEDITMRALRILQQIDVLYAEDTRTARKLLSFYEIHIPRIYSLPQFKELKEAMKVVNYIKDEGLSVGIISESGTPLISDPGYYVIQMALQNGVKIVSIPGPCACINALVGSGIPSNSFTFIGFLPKQKNQRIQVLKDFAQTSQGKTSTESLVVYVSDSKIQDTLNDCIEIYGEDLRCCLARELTKKKECYMRGSLKEIFQICQEQEIFGQLVLILQLKDYANFKQQSECDNIQEEVKQQIQMMLREGQKVKDISRILSQKYLVSKSQTYAQVLQYQKEIQNDQSK